MERVHFGISVERQTSGSSLYDENGPVITTIHYFVFLVLPVVSVRGLKVQLFTLDLKSFKIFIYGHLVITVINTKEIIFFTYFVNRDNLLV